MRQDNQYGLLELTEDLCQYTSGVVAEENAGLFRRLGQELPFTLHRFPSGSEFNGWVVAELWKVRKALLLKDGEVVFDGRSNPLGVGFYSRSFSGELDFEELKPHLVTNPELSEGYMFHCMWQYRPWAADWVLSMPYRLYRTLGPGRYRVELETSYEPGEMLVAEYLHQGRSPQTILLNSNTCHPRMANDGFAGSAILIRLCQWLRQQDTYYSYRLILAPEHLGSIFYLRDKSPSEIADLVSGIFCEMPGTPGPIKATSTFLGNQPLDRAFRNAMRHYSRDWTTVPWRQGAGNDETVWEAPGYEIPFVEATRCQETFAPYPEYHSHLDNPDLMDERLLNEFYEVLQQVLFILEHNATVHRRFNGLLCLSNPRFDLYQERQDPSVAKDLPGDAEKWGYLQDCLLRYFDGSTTILDIAEKHDLPFERLYRYLLRFQEKSLVELRFAPIERVPVSQGAA